MSEVKSKKKIKSISAIRYQNKIESIHDEEVSIVEFPTSYKEYNEDQELILEISWDHNGGLSEKFTYDFENGHVIREKIYLDEDEVAEEYQYSYSANGLIEKAIVSYLDGTKDICNYSYDEDGKLVLKEFVDEDGDIGEREEYHYTDGRLVKYTKHGDFGSEEETTQVWEGDKLIEKKQNLLLEEDYVLTNNEYNEQGQLIVRKEYKSNGHVNNTYKYAYNEDGSLDSVYQHEDNYEHTIHYQYDDNGNEIYMEDLNLDGSLNFKVERSYDEDGNVLESSVEMYADEMMLESQYMVKYTYNFFD